MTKEELEKEAEEYAGTVHRYRDAQGETEQMEDVAEAWKKGYEAGRPKWHKVADGDLPKTKKKVLVLLKDVEEPILDYYRQDGLWNYALENEVIAWKEIVLPELPKESE